MMDWSLIEKVNQLERSAMALDAVFGLSSKEGRMPSFPEAHEADLLSREIMEIVQSMPQQPCLDIEDPVLRNEMADRLLRIQQTIAGSLSPAKKPAQRVARAVRNPFAASASAITAYGSY